MPQSHDQNFKNLILDYPREALWLFAATEADQIDAGVRILPLREQQLKERLGDRFRELDVPLLLEWPDGRRAALLFVVEEHTETRRFSIHRLAHYCLDLADLLATDRLVPVVVFLHPGHFASELVLGGDRQRFLEFRYLAYTLFQTRAREHFDSPNLVARLNLPNMAYAPEEKIDIYAQAVRGLLQMEPDPDPERQIKYLDFIDIYADLDDNERALYQQRYAHEAAIMSGFAEPFIQKDLQAGTSKAAPPRPIPAPLGRTASSIRPGRSHRKSPDHLLQLVTCNLKLPPRGLTKRWLRHRSRHAGIRSSLGWS